MLIFDNTLTVFRSDLSEFDDVDIAAMIVIIVKLIRLRNSDPQRSELCIIES